MPRESVSMGTGLPANACSASVLYVLPKILSLEVSVTSLAMLTMLKEQSTNSGTTHISQYVANSLWAVNLQNSKLFL